MRLKIYCQSIQYFILDACVLYENMWNIFILLYVNIAPFMLNCSRTQNEWECHFSSSFRNFPSIWIIIHMIYLFIYRRSNTIFPFPFYSSGGPLIFCFHNFFFFVLAFVCFHILLLLFPSSSFLFSRFLRELMMRKMGKLCREINFTYDIQFSIIGFFGI